jgi:hypothetical protein
MNPSASILASALAHCYHRANLGWSVDGRWSWLLRHLEAHPEASAGMWLLWQTELELTGQDVSQAAHWLAWEFWDEARNREE